MATGGRIIISEEDKWKVIAIYKKCNGNAVEASRQLNYDAQLIRDYWIDAGLKSKGNFVSPDEAKEILGAYKICKGSAREASRRFHYTPVTITKYWRKAKLI